MTKQIALVGSVLLILTTAAFAQSRDSLRYIVQMKSGDAFRGNLVDHTDSTVVVVTEFGRINVRKELVEEFIPLSGPYRHRPLHFLMPSASPAGPGVFASNYELGFWFAGVGLGYGATITAGATLVPSIPFSQQFYHAGAKFTIERNAEFELALGAAYTFITTDHPYAHVYAVGTFPVGTARYSAMIIYKATGADVARIAIAPFGGDTTDFTLFYDGAIGAAFGFDAPAFGRDDMMWVGEIWNNDLRKPANTVSMLGLRVMNESMAADFGFALFTAPFIVPVVSFTYTP
jgi:hypothetical protein